MSQVQVGINSRADGAAPAPLISAATELPDTRTVGLVVRKTMSASLHVPPKRRMISYEAGTPRKAHSLTERHSVMECTLLTTKARLR